MSRLGSVLFLAAGDILIDSRRFVSSEDIFKSHRTACSVYLYGSCQSPPRLAAMPDSVPFRESRHVRTIQECNRNLRLRPPSGL